MKPGTVGTTFGVAGSILDITRIFGIQKRQDGKKRNVLSKYLVPRTLTLMERTYPPLQTLTAEIDLTENRG